MGIEVACEAKAVITVQPTVICMAARMVWMEDGFHTVLNRCYNNHMSLELFGFVIHYGTYKAFF